MTAPTRLTSPLLAAAPGVTHAFFTRAGGVSKGLYASLNVGLGSGDDPAAVLENRRRAAEAMGARPEALATCYQIHSATVRTAQGAWADARPEGDGVVTAHSGVLCGALAADCAPVLIADPQARVVAAVHAGWRGVISSVLPAAIAAMRSLGATRIRAAIGPCISAPNFEVGPEVLAEFNRVFGPGAGICTHRPDGKGTVDLKAALALQLRAADITDIEIFPHCTVESSELFFSHRRDAGRTGRMIALISPRASRS
jgi:YfiH family protein